MFTSLPIRFRNTALVAFAFVTLAAMYIFQRVDYFYYLRQLVGISIDPHPYTTFIVNRVIRLTVNDSACLLLIVLWFKENKYVRIAGFIFLLELFFILPLYLVFKLSLEGDSEISSPWLSQIHRLIVNPMLMILLMAAFFYQRRLSNTG